MAQPIGIASCKVSEVIETILPIVELCGGKLSLAGRSARHIINGCHFGDIDFAIKLPSLAKIDAYALCILGYVRTKVRQACIRESASEGSSFKIFERTFMNIDCGRVQICLRRENYKPIFLSEAIRIQVDSNKKPVVTSCCSSLSKVLKAIKKQRIRFTDPHEKEPGIDTCIRYLREVTCGGVAPHNTMPLLKRAIEQWGPLNGTEEFFEHHPVTDDFRFAVYLNASYTFFHLFGPLPNGWIENLLAKLGSLSPTHPTLKVAQDFLQTKRGILSNKLLFDLIPFLLHSKQALLKEHEANGRWVMQVPFDSDGDEMQDKSGFLVMPFATHISCNEKESKELLALALNICETGEASQLLESLRLGNQKVEALLWCFELFPTGKDLILQIIEEFHDLPRWELEMHYLEALKDPLALHRWNPFPSISNIQERVLFAQKVEERLGSQLLSQWMRRFYETMPLNLQELFLFADPDLIRPLILHFCSKPSPEVITRAWQVIRNIRSWNASEILIAEEFLKQVLEEKAYNKATLPIIKLAALHIEKDLPIDIFTQLDAKQLRVVIHHLSSFDRYKPHLIFAGMQKRRGEWEDILSDLIPIASNSNDPFWNLLFSHEFTQSFQTKRNRAYLRLYPINSSAGKTDYYEVILKDRQAWKDYPEKAMLIKYFINSSVLPIILQELTIAELRPNLPILFGKGYKSHFFKHLLPKFEQEDTQNSIPELISLANCDGLADEVLQLFKKHLGQSYYQNALLIKEKILQVFIEMSGEKACDLLFITQLQSASEQLLSQLWQACQKSPHAEAIATLYLQHLVQHLHLINHEIACICTLYERLSHNTDLFLPKSIIARFNEAQLTRFLHASENRMGIYLPLLLTLPNLQGSHHKILDPHFQKLWSSYSVDMRFRIFENYYKPPNKITWNSRFEDDLKALLPKERLNYAMKIVDLCFALDNTTLITNFYNLKLQHLLPVGHDLALRRYYQDLFIKDPKGKPHAYEFIASTDRKKKGIGRVAGCLASCGIAIGAFVIKQLLRKWLSS